MPPKATTPTTIAFLRDHPLDSPADLVGAGPTGVAAPDGDERRGVANQIEGVPVSRET